MKINITKIPADKSIKDVVCIVAVDSVYNTRVIQLTGTEKEKLAQYKEAFGKDWSGLPESIASELVNEPLIGSLELGRFKRLKNKATLETEEKLRQLSLEAKRYLAENEALKDKRVTNKELVETQLSE